MPIALDDEPDVAVVAGASRDYELAHPARPPLVEVAESSFDEDRGDKAGPYAGARVPEYWVVNLVSRLLEVRREPAPTAPAPFAWSYRIVTVRAPGAPVRPLARSTGRIQVDDLLPRFRSCSAPGRDHHPDPDACPEPEPSGMQRPLDGTFGA